jgi:hypothetical protein
VDLYELHFGRDPELSIPEPPKVEVYRACCDQWHENYDPISEVEKLSKAFRFLKDELELDDEIWNVWMEALLDNDLWTAFREKVLPTFPAEERERLWAKARRKAGFS